MITIPSDIQDLILCLFDFFRIFLFFVYTPVMKSLLIIAQMVELHRFYFVNLIARHFPNNVMTAVTDRKSTSTNLLCKTTLQVMSIKYKV